MSETKLVSPLLDGFTLGSPISNHSGVCCCPAMKKNSDTKYIVKVIAVPASQTQLDALLVTGAYRDPAAALDYFRRQAEGISQEASLLQKLSRLDGFLSFDGCQVTPMRKNRLGYHIYLLSEYRYSLEKFIRRHPVTHLEAVNLGLDLCSALTVCRQAGYLYADLKPTNVYVGDDHVFRISDLGFVAMDSLKFTSMPEKYISPYSAPEVHDAMCTLNDTVDTYALGMILYRVFNGGKLPEMPKDPAQELPAPSHANEEISKIILKACAPKPEDRWHDPAEMGQALIAYMQKSTVNNTPLSPEEENAASANAAQETIRFDPAEFSANAESTPTENTDKTILLPTLLAEPEAAEAPAAEAEEAAEASDPEPVPEPEPEATVPMDPDIANIISTLDSPAEPEAQPSADDPVVSEPEPALVGAADSFDLESELNEVSSLLGSTRPTASRTASAKSSVQPTPVVMGKKSNAGKHFLITLLILVILAAAVFCGYCYYQFIYMQSVDGISIEGTQSKMTVSLKTEVEDELLTVVCTDTFGNEVRQSVLNGQAVFTDLLPNSLYNVSVEISGPHKLIGKTSDVFTTEAQTEVVSFTAVTGQEDGSVLLAMTVHGHEPSQWIVHCAAEGESEITETFSGHSVTVKGLTIGKEYTITLDTNEEMELMGQNSITFTASSVISANNLAVVSRIDGGLTVCWEAPQSYTVENWVVRCYGEGYDETQTVSGTMAVFTKTKDSVEYTVEVTAEGMTQPSRTTVTANPVTITGFAVDDSYPQELRLSWTYDGVDPEGGWLLNYTMDGSEFTNVVKCSEPNALIAPRVPGALYQFTIQAANETTVFNSIQSFQCPAGAPYEGHSLSADKITARLLETPSNGSWSIDSVGSSAYKDRFTSVQKISIVLEAGVRFYLDSEDLNILFVIRDGNGKVIPNLTEQIRADWHDLWLSGGGNRAQLSLPSTPPLTGAYRMDLYFNGKFVASANFIIA